MLKKAAIAVGTFVLLVLLLILGDRAIKQQDSREPKEAETPSAPPPIAASLPPPPPPSASATHEGLLYGRITTVDGVVYEGRMRFGGDQEASWGDYFNGTKKKNPWIMDLPPELAPKESKGFQIFGLKLGHDDGARDFDRLFMARLGDIVRIESHGGEVHVILKSGTVFDLNRFEASDFDDGVRIWDVKQGPVDLDSLRVSTIELLATPKLPEAPARIYGTVHTRHGDFAGFLQWNRQKSLGSDTLDGHDGTNSITLRFDALRSIEHRPGDKLAVTLVDGRELALIDTGDGALGTYVDDPRYGRVLISWEAIERIDLAAGGDGPTYGDFPKGQPLTGFVTLRDGNRLTGRLVYDLDESETTETLDAPSQGVDFTIPFGLIASIVAPGSEVSGGEPGRVKLHSGEELVFERAGDLGKSNNGLLVLVEGRKPAYLKWLDVARIDFDKPPAMWPSGKAVH